MSADNNTSFVEIDNDESATTVRFPLSIDRANELLREFVQSSVPDASMIDEIHILVSPAAIKRAYDAIPIPPEIIERK